MRTLWQMAAGSMLLLTCLGGVAEAQQRYLPPPLKLSPLVYNSPYGPRNKVSTKQYQFHRGVDYHGGLGTPIYAVQGSTIDKLDFEGVASSGWVLGITGGPSDTYPLARFSYLHTFDNNFLGHEDSLPMDAEGNKVYANASVNGTAQQITLEQLTSPSGTHCFAIIFWLDLENDVPDRALSPCPGLSVGDPQLGVVTTNQVDASQGDPIAVVGESGGAQTSGPHLHLQVNYGEQNPLLYVTHGATNPPRYPISLFKDQGTDIASLNNGVVPLNDGEVLDPNQYGSNSPLIIETEATYSAVGHDLDQIQILMAKSDANVNPSCEQPTANVTTFRCFNYGGTGSASRNVFFGYEDINTAVLAQGIFPAEDNGGVVDFLTNPVDLTTLDPGSYLVSISATDVLGENLQPSPVEVKIPPKLTVTVFGNGQVVSSPQGINCGSGSTCNFWFVNGYPKVNVQLTALPDNGAQFTLWSNDCSGSDPSTSVLMTTDSKLCGAFFTTLSFTGSWNTTYGPMTLSQTGNFVSGNYAGGFNGTITGTVTITSDGSLVLKGFWFDNTGTGSLVFDLNPDGQKFVGTWERFTGIGNSGGTWDGTRLQ